MKKGRRRFLATVGTAAIAPVLPSFPAAAQQRDAAPAGRVDKNALKGGEQIAGLHFTDAQEDAALAGVNRNLGSYETLRGVQVPMNTEPAIIFRPIRGLTPQSSQRSQSTLAPKKITYTRPRRVEIASSIESVAFEPVTVLASLIESRKVSSTDLTRMYLDRLKKYGDKLHCVITLTEDLALQQAANADRELKSGHYRGPLHGIPWGAKDLLDTKGIRTTWGAAPYEQRVPDVDATVVERLRDAGAVLVAKLSMGALAQGGVWYGGSTRNPWAPDQSSSGSSAGPGAATSAGLVGFAIGTETRGSIISPSSTCGVVGLRPTYGRVSRYGAMALSWTMDKLGPMCRSVEDCAIVFNAIYGSDGRDETVVDAPFDWNPDVPLSKIRFGYLANEFEVQQPNAGRGGGGAGGGRGGGRGTVDPATLRRRAEERSTLLKDALEVLRSQGAKIEPVTLPDFPTNAINFILDAEAAAAFDDLTRSPDIEKMTNSSWPTTFRESRFIPAVEYIRAQRARTLLCRKMEALMSTVDVFLSPSGGASLGITNLTGHPAACLKAGFVDGLPQALMITGRLYDEATVLRVALAYERATKWHTMNPALDENLRKMTTADAGQDGLARQVRQAGQVGEVADGHDL
ncbi:MAG TPA: amidase [Vicinamibacterales bacterium]|nr:amidase [Vicinamibacterales bacterium]